MPGQMLPATPLVGIGETGRRVGENHHRACISDEMVEKMRDMREVDGMSYVAIAKVTGVSFSSVAMICTYQRRNSRAVRYEDQNGKAVTLYG